MPLSSSFRYGLADLTSHQINMLASYNQCPVCDIPNPDREHITKHFAEELQEVVENMPDPLACSQCHFTGSSSHAVAIHIGIVHAQLEMFLSDTTHVHTKRNELFAASLNARGAAGGGVTLTKINKGARGSPSASGPPPMRLAPGAQRPAQVSGPSLLKMNSPQMPNMLAAAMGLAE